ncbi:hypothetical protein PT974_03565 [Cladobotryum mycophilum]|uniref:Serine protease n=1 Tax=Cladobotryum mycophilum TaxID=491253 RepID=A0ABR0SSN1_9HYPO
MASESGFELNPELYDVAWDRLPRAEERGGLQFSQNQTRSEWIVKLKFMQGDERSGTGFYVNIPDTEYHVLMTAGHNLIDKKGDLSTNIEIHPPPAVTSSSDWKVLISPSYKEHPEVSNPDVDWGVILIPRKDESPRGFGFSLKLAYDDLYNEELTVGGYREATAAGTPDISTGCCLASRPDHLEYDVATQKGLSGSPVFIAYKGHDTAICIQ